VDTVKFIVQFDELVNDFSATNITYNNGQIINFKSKIYNNPTKNQDMYEVTAVGNQTEGRHYVFIPENVTADAVGNLNKASDTLAWFYDGTPPIIDNLYAIDQNSGNTLAEGSITQSNYIRLKIRFNESLGRYEYIDSRFNFTTASLKVTNGNIQDWLRREDEYCNTGEAGCNIDYFVDIGLDQSNYGEVIIEIADSSFMDLAGNINTESYRFSFKYGPEENFQDDDSDGVENYMDNCPDTPTNAEVDASGCSVAQIDTDISGRWKVVFNSWNNDDNGYWKAPDNAPPEMISRNDWDCFLDDLYVFESNGSFSNDLGSTTWIQPFQVALDSMSNLCGTPVSPFDGSSTTHTYTRTGNTKGIITINGVGAYLGLAEMTNVENLNGSEAQANGVYPDIPASRFYAYEIEGDYLLLKIEVETEVGYNGSTTYQFKLQKE
jgi:hypothetical protein